MLAYLHMGKIIFNKMKNRINPQVPNLPYGAWVHYSDRTTGSKICKFLVRLVVEKHIRSWVDLEKTKGSFPGVSKQFFLIWVRPL